MSTSYPDRLRLALEMLSMIFDRDGGIISDDDLLDVAEAFTIDPLSADVRGDYHRLVHSLDMATMARPE